jgi:thiamine-phosphate pyrophosphorylase
MKFPGLYPIVDGEALRARGLSVMEFARGLRKAGVTLLQYRDKTGDEQVIQENAERIGEIFDGSGAWLVMNDRTDVMMLARWHGVHVGQDDLSPEDARIVIGA